MADNQPITAAGILSLWNSMYSESEIHVAKDKKELLALLGKYPSALTVLDYTLFDMPGMETLLIIGLRFPQVRWLLFSDDLSEAFLHRIVLEKQFSVVLKDASIEEIRQALQQGYAIVKKQFLCERVRTLLNSRKEMIDKLSLTSTEKEILKAIALGKTSQMIADERCSSIHTISTHRKNIFRKIGVNNLLEATKYAAQTGLVDMSEYYI
ncbi:MAG: response regulator transcription factor [Tannerella sp.]|jgi:DNA-binding NarL/FixJ family response regulator|nr:response regulator transcription factor [Tannerella sp.]